MLHVIVYDITNDKRLRRVASLCEDYGIRIEKSVFECEMDESLHAAFWGKMKALVDESSDRVVDYAIDKSDRSRVVSIGPQVARPGSVYVF